MPLYAEILISAYYTKQEQTGIIIQAGNLISAGQSPHSVLSQKTTYRQRSVEIFFLLTAYASNIFYF